MTCIIVEDEPIARDILRQYISELDFLDLIAEFDNGVSAVSFLRKQEVDVLFLDINMPKLSGIDLIRSLSHPPKIVLTTAYSEYALEGYELDVIDYLLKPFSFERFLKAVNKVSKLLESEQASDESQPLIIKADGKTYRIDEEDILFVESLGDYVTLHTSSEKLTFNQSLKSFLEKLSPDSFIRVHKSFVVSLSKINYVEGNMISVGEKEIPIGNAFKDDFKNKFLKV
ncbi:MAG: DNA-binding response regulator [Balneola sp.]|nr:MAG: DNA-binding response regulator [Balneola sp.]